MELNKKQMGGIVGLAVFLSSLGTLVYDPNKTYYCEPEDSVKEFVRCSDTFMTCYDISGKGDRCVGGVWKPIGDFIEENKDRPDSIRVYANEKWWDCPTQEGVVESYTYCTSDIYEGYLGELV